MDGDRLVETVDCDGVRFSGYGGDLHITVVDYSADPVHLPNAGLLRLGLRVEDPRLVQPSLALRIRELRRVTGDPTATIVGPPPRGLGLSGFYLAAVREGLDLFIEDPEERELGLTTAALGLVGLAPIWPIVEDAASILGDDLESARRQDYFESDWGPSAFELSERGATRVSGPGYIADERAEVRRITTAKVRARFESASRGPGNAARRSRRAIH